jgi:5-methylcytosine-specific restriction endonuclease McrA
MSHVFAVATNKQPLNPVHPARARKLLARGKAAVYRRYPFTIILNIAIDEQGTVAGYETREYLLEKWGRKCAYCGKEKVPLQIEHITPRAKGGSGESAAQRCHGCQRDQMAIVELLAGSRTPC